MEKRDWTRRHMLGLAAAGSIGTLAFGRDATAQAGGGLLERVRKAGVIKIGMTNGLPYSLLNPDGSVDGVAPVIVQRIMARLGVPKVEGIAVTYGQLIPGLLANRWDMVGADMTITTERCGQVAYCDPFTVDYGAYVHLPNAFPDPPKTLKEIGARKIRLGIITGAYNIKLIQGFYEKPGDYMTMYPDTTALLAALTADRIDLGATGVRAIRAVLQNKPGTYKYLYPLPDDMVSAASAAFRLEDTDLTTAFRTEFQKMKKSGEWEKIITSFDFEVFPGRENVTAEQACSPSFI